MVKVLVADTCKSSLVMTTEIFKDRIPGCTVMIATTGAECVEIVKNNTLDMVVADFDLPDADGVNLTHVLRKIYNGPVVLTAFPEKIVNEAIEKELFAYADSLGWVPKPIKFEVMEEKIEKYILNKLRVIKRFDTNYPAMVIGKGAGRGKRAPKCSGNLNNLSLRGAGVLLEGEMKDIKIGDEITLNVDIPENILNGEVLEAKKVIGKKKASTIKTKTTKFKAKVAWADKKKTKLGFEFDKLTNAEMKQLDRLLRASMSE